MTPNFKLKYHGSPGQAINRLMAAPISCRDAGVPFFFKQWGGVQKKKAGRQLNGTTYDEQPVHVARTAPPEPQRKDDIAEWERGAVQFA